MPAIVFCLRAWPAPTFKIKIKVAGAAPHAGYFLLRRQKKVTKEKATPVCRPSGALRCSTGQASS
jgi:hypothetical protein